MFESIPIREFEKRSAITDPNLKVLWGDAFQVISLRTMKRIVRVHVMPNSYLETLVQNITLVDSNIRPYKGCLVKPFVIDPSALLIAQRFVERKKVDSLLYNLSAVLQGFCIGRGIVNLTPLIVYGTDDDDQLAIAHYLPPIIEENNGKQILLDGIHRNFLVYNVGATLQAVRIIKVRVPFPGKAHPWEEIKLVDEKPSPDKRFFELEPELFRDLKRIGIDG